MGTSDGACVGWVLTYGEHLNSLLDIRLDVVGEDDHGAAVLLEVVDLEYLLLLDFEE